MKRHAKSLVGLLKNHYGMLKPIQGAEVGVWRGELSEQLLIQLPRLTLFLVDPWEQLGEATPTMKKELDEIIAARKEAEGRTCYHRSVIVQKTSMDAAAEMLKCGNQFHFVFIDACHLYESVRDDINAWYPLVKPNGLICGHDYDGVGDRRCGWGVKRAVDEKFGEQNVSTLPGNIWFVQKV